MLLLSEGPHIYCSLLCGTLQTKWVSVVVLVDYYCPYTFVHFCMFKQSTHHQNVFFAHGSMHEWQTHTYICEEGFLKKLLSFHPLNELFVGFIHFHVEKTICDVYLKLTIILLLYVRSSHSTWCQGWLSNDKPASLVVVVRSQLFTIHCDIYIIHLGFPLLSTTNEILEAIRMNEH